MVNFHYNNALTPLGSRDSFYYHMMPKCVVKWQIFIVLLRFTFALKLSFDPNDVRINFEPEKLPKLFEGLLRKGYYELAIKLLQSESSDFIPSYCVMWRISNNSDLIFRIWDDYFAGEIDEKQLKELILPECIAESYMTMINLTETMIEALPHSLLQAPDFPVRLLDQQLVELILKRAIERRPHDPRIKWSKWVLSENVSYPSQSKFYSEFGWQLVSKEDFEDLTSSKAEQLMQWLLLSNSAAFKKLSQEEVLMRTLTLFAWDSPVKCSKAFEQLAAFFARYFSRTSTLVLKIMRYRETEGSISDLLDVIEVLRIYLQNPENVVIGDWFIGILGIWRQGLKRLKLITSGSIDIVQRILNFALNTVDPTFLGISKLPELFDPSFRKMIENAVYDKYVDNNQDLLLFYREFPDFFQETFAEQIPFRIRFGAFLRQKRANNSNSIQRSTNNYKLDMKVFRTIGPKDFLMFMADRFRQGVDEFSRFSLEPLIGISFAGMTLTFKNLVELFLISIKAMSSEWFQIGSDGWIPLPYCSSLMWEFLGYFLMQARILKMDAAMIQLDRQFILEMMQESPSEEYILKLASPFQKCKMNDIRLLSWNMAQSFSVSSLFPSDEHDLFYTKDQMIDCETLVRELYKKGMEAMRLGVNYLLDPFKFTAHEVQMILKPK